MKFKTRAKQRLYVDHQPLWQKLELILSRIEKKGHAGLTRQELQELGGLYRCVAADLARARAQAKAGQNDQELQIYLNSLAVRAHNQIYLDESNSWQQFFNFFWYGFPARVRKYAPYIIAAFLIFLAPLALSYYYTLTEPGFTDLEFVPGHSLLPEEMRSSIEAHKLWTADKAK